MNEPLVSIIVPVYNTAKYLPRCLESIGNQTYTNLEIIIVDNNSTDGSADIARFYADKDRRVVLTAEEMQGQGPARDKGISVARGEWICFLDSDDFIHPRFVEILLHTALCNHCLTVQCRYKEIYYEDGHVDTLEEEDVKILNWREYLLYIFANQNKGHAPFGVWLNIYHRSLFNEAHFDGLSYGEDSYIAPKLLYAASGHPAAVVNQVLYYYFVREGSTLHSKVSLKMLDHWYAKQCAANFWKEKGEYELYPFFYSIFFRILVIDYLKFCVHLPNEKPRYEFMYKKILENYDEAERFGEELLVIHPGAKTAWEQLVQSRAHYIQYGFGSYGKIVFPMLRDLGLHIAEIWDKKADGRQSVDGIPILQPHILQKNENVVGLITVQNSLENIRIALAMKQHGVSKTIPCSILRYAFRYGIYKKYLPFMLETYERSVV